MSSPDHRPVRHVVPEHEKRCVWMTAGILSYRICARDYDCSKCLLDQALSMRCGPSVEGGMDPLPPLHFLHRGHAWLHISDDGEGVVGLDDFAQRLIGHVSWMDLPEPGDRLEQGKPAFRISHGSTETDVLAPATGRVTAVNESLRQNPAIVNRSPYDAGWVLRMTPENLAVDVPRLLFGRTVEAWVCDETRTLETEIARGFGLPEDDMDSVRINDGGEIPAEFLTGLPSEERDRIVNIFFARRPSGASPDPMGAQS